jgi:hypothetical protein
MEVDYQGQSFGLEIGVYLRSFYGDWDDRSKDLKPSYCNQAKDESGNREWHYPA